MVRNYYCDYCDKRLKDDVQIRKKHIEGLQHQKAMKEHYALYKSPEQILAEESAKKPCSWFQTGSCQYGLSCHNSHYTADQLNNLRQHIQHDEWRKKQPKHFNRKTMETFVTKRNQQKHEQNDRILKNIWNYPDELLAYGSSLPPSLQIINPDLLIPEKFEHWG